MALFLQVARQAGRPAQLAPAVTLALLPGFLFGWVLLGILQLLYMGRLTLRTGRLTDETSSS